MKLEWTAAAVADLHGIDKWLIEHADPLIAVWQLERIRDKARRLLNFPTRGPMLGADWHYSQVEQTPHLIIYRVSVEKVQILRIRHNRQDWRPS